MRYLDKNGKVRSNAEIAMLGVVALKMPGMKLRWDAQAMKFTNCTEANMFVDPPYRKGWTL